MADGPTDVPVVMRRFVLALVAFGLIGSGAELLLLEHYEDSWQLVPLFLIVLTLGAIAVHLLAAGAGSVYGLRVLMSALVLAGAVGVSLHYRGNLEFQLEMDATQSGWPLFMKAIRAKTPPALAPGVMAQLGLLGLAYTYRHPALGRGTPAHRRRSP